MRFPTLVAVLMAAALLSGFAATLSPSAWAQGEVAIYSEDFENGPGGWVPVDLTEQSAYWHHDMWQGSSVAWCGTDDPSFATPPGYGNFWVQDLTKAFTVPFLDPNLRFSIQFDTEVAYDFIRLQLSNDGGVTFEDLHLDGPSFQGWWWTGETWCNGWYDDCCPDRAGWLHGDSQGFQEHTVDLRLDAGQEVLLRFRFFSDGAWSDEDGIFDTDGACRLDWVRLGAGPLDDFNGSLDGWVASGGGVGGGPYRLETDLGGNPSHAWAAYDLDGPHAGQFPWTPEEDAEIGRRVRIGIESPVISIPADQEAYILEFDVYRDLPLDEWIFYDFQIATPAPEDGGSWRSDGYVYYAPDDPPVWDTFRIDLTNVYLYSDAGNPVYGSLIEPGATSMKIRLHCHEYPYPLGIPFIGWHPPGPFFDNVRFLVPGGPGILAGTVYADCPTPDTPLFGVKLALYDTNGAEVGTMVTDAGGAFEMEVLAGAYTLSLITPLGYSAVPAEYLVDVAVGGTTVQDFSLTCLDIASSPRSIGYWKHQVSVATGGGGKGQGHRIKPRKGDPEEEAGDVTSPVCDYLDLIADHFNGNMVNQVLVYEPPGSELCVDKLAVATMLLNLHGRQEMIARARQQLVALLLNVAAGNIHLMEVISEDGATVSQAITYCDNLIDDPVGDHETAKDIADLVNNGLPVPAGVIPEDTDNIAYRHAIEPPAAQLFESQANPFIPGTPIRFSLANASPYRLMIHDIAGRLVKTFDGQGHKGENAIAWDGLDIGAKSGTYFLSLETDGLKDAKRIVVLK
ncbi:MAG: T9SS type A sorting domain-containing protein [Candidatus Eisenbacteria sp.]|nr:T9SS type A sorting domain-containing protein [Candidatus Eisenbacteria bacterium]